jgi:hypothetical protein
MNELSSNHTVSAPAFLPPPCASNPQPDPVIADLICGLRAAVSHPNIGPVARETLRRIRQVQGTTSLTGITEHVAQFFHVKVDALLSRDRTQHVAFCRQVVAYMCRTVTDASYPVIGQYLRRDHSSIIAAVTVVERRMQREGAFRRQMETLRYEITGEIPRGASLALAGSRPAAAAA